MTTIPEEKSLEWHEERRRYIGGSDANIIMNGTDEQRYDLWLLKTGVKQPEDLSNVFQVVLGSYTEPFNLAWFAKKTGFQLLPHPGRVVLNGSWMACTPDGLLADAVVECKHTSERVPMADVLARYQPQLQHSMVVLGLKRAYLSVIFGNTYDYLEVEFDPAYADALIQAEKEFWECVTLKLPPGPGGERVTPPEAVRVIDMTGNNEWAAAAADWFANAEANKTFDRAANTLRSLVPADAKSAAGHGIALKRDKRGALRISEVKS